MNAVAIALIGWAAFEYYLRWRNRAARKTWDWSFLAVFVTLAAGLVIAFTAHSRAPSAGMDGGAAAVAVGTTIVVAGASLRLWAIIVLGRFFTVTVTIQPEHQVVDTGPYRVIRHPSYTGLLLVFLGTGIALDNWISLLALATIPLIGLLIRIHVEEAALERALGDSYTSYEARTKRLIPGVW